MISSILFQKQFINKVEQILHSPCNIPNKMLEMTVVVDQNLSKEKVKEVIPNLLKMLKRHSEVFRNVRFNMVHWRTNETITNQVIPMSIAMLGSHYEVYESQYQAKDYSCLMQNLKLFHARSKLILVITDGNYEISDEVELKKMMQPFLYRKVMNVVIGDNIELR